MISTIDALLGHEISQLASSFGPWGHTKLIVSRVSATLGVTKDTEHLREALLSGKAGTCPKQLLSGLVGASSTDFGDGSMTSAMILCAMLRDLSSTPRSESSCIRERVEKLQALDCIMHSMRVEQDDIVSFFIDSNIWSRVEHVRDITYLWRSILVPATNPAVALNIDNVLTKWLLLPTNMTFDRLACCIQEILSHFDTSVICNLSPSRSISESSPIAASECIIQGRCKDFHALQASSTKPAKFRFICAKHLVYPGGAYSIVNSTSNAPVTVQIQSLSALNAMTSVSTDLMKRLRTAINATASGCYTDGGGARDKDICVIVCGDDAKDDTMHAAAKYGFTLIDCVPKGYLRRLCKISSITLWDTLTDFIEEQQQQQRIPISPSKYIPGSSTCSGSESEKTTGTGIETAHHLYQHPSYHCNCNYYGEFSGLQRVQLGAAEMNYVLSGLTVRAAAMTSSSPPSTTSGDNSAHHTAAPAVQLQPQQLLVPQLLLHCGSAVSCSMFTRLIKRCLTATLALLEGGGASACLTVRNHSNVSSPSFKAGPADDGTGSSGSDDVVQSGQETSTVTRKEQQTVAAAAAASPKKMGASSSSRLDLKRIVVPGAGAAEMGWSAFWSKIADKLVAYDCSTTTSIPVHNNSSNDDDDSGGVVNESKTNDHDSIFAAAAAAQKMSSQSPAGATADEDVNNSYMKRTRSRQYADIIPPLVDTFASRIIDRAVHQLQPHVSQPSSKSSLQQQQKLTKAERDLIHNTVLHIASLCRLISEAYAAVPKQLLVNSTLNHPCLIAPVVNPRTVNSSRSRGSGGVTKERAFHFTAFPTRLSRDSFGVATGSISGISSTPPLLSDHYHSINGSATTGGSKSVVTNKLWLQWKEHFMTPYSQQQRIRTASTSSSRGSSDSDISDITSTCPAGRLGLPMAVLSPDKTSLVAFERHPSLCDVMDYGLGDKHEQQQQATVVVVTSATQFLNTFFTVLEAYRLHLRTGGSQGIIQVKRLNKNVHGSRIISSSSYRRKSSLDDDDEDDDDDDDTSSLSSENTSDERYSIE